jgi:hypothetical protein
MSIRRSISKKLRFEVFKRDSFKCQYCGKCAPDVILHVDHIHPVSKGGENDILNLITACADCNGGKSDRLLSDQSVMAKQRAQLEELNERREQLEQMLAWREGLTEIDDIAVDAAVAAWHALTPKWGLNEKGKADLRRLVEKLGLPAVLDAIKVCERYLEKDDSGAITSESVNLAFGKIGGVARMSKEPDWKRQLFYIRGIMRNRFGYVNEHEAIRMLELAYQHGASIDELKSVVFGARSWSGWCRDMGYYMEAR